MGGSFGRQTRRSSESGGEEPSEEPSGEPTVIGERNKELLTNTGSRGGEVSSWGLEAMGCRMRNRQSPG